MISQEILMQNILTVFLNVHLRLAIGEPEVDEKILVGFSLPLLITWPCRISIWLFNEICDARPEGRIA